jgi:hypothetical protein
VIAPMLHVGGGVEVADLFGEDFVCALHRTHPALRSRLPPTSFARQFRVVVRQSPRSVTPVPARSFAPIDRAHFLEGWGDLDRLMEPGPWQAWSGVINPYPASAPLDQLEALGNTAASARPEGAGGEQAQAVVAEATALLRCDRPDRRHACAAGFAGVTERIS